MSLFVTHYKERKAHILRYTPLLTEYRKTLNDSDAETALNVFTTLELSLQDLGGSNETRQAVEDLLTFSAFFNTIRVGEDLPRTAAINDRPGWVHLFTSGDGDVWDHYKYHDAVSNLSHLSLLQSLTPGDTIYFSLHPLVADWLRLRRDLPFRRACTLQSCSVVKSLPDSVD